MSFEEFRKVVRELKKKYPSKLPLYERTWDYLEFIGSTDIEEAAKKCNLKELTTAIAATESLISQIILTLHPDTEDTARLRDANFKILKEEVPKILVSNCGCKIGQESEKPKAPTKAELEMWEEEEERRRGLRG